MRHHQMLLPLVTALLLTTPRAIADVLVIDAASGPGSQYTVLQFAIEAAQPGDTLLLRSGSYWAFSLVGKGLSLVAEEGASVTVVGPSKVRSVPAGETVLVRGLDFKTDTTLFVLQGALGLEGCDGAVWLEDCSVIARDVLQPLPGRMSALSVKACRQVVLLRSTVEGYGFLSTFAGTGVGLTGMSCEFSDVTVQGSSVGAFFAIPEGVDEDGHAGLAMLGGQVHAAGSTFQGGSGANSLLIGFGCTKPTSGGDAVSVAGTGVFLGLDNTYLPGAAGLIACTPLPPGPLPTPGANVGVGSLAQHVALSGLARDFEAASPVRELAQFVLAFDVQPFEDVFLLVGSQPLGLFVQPLGGSLLVWGTLQILPLGKADGSGTLDLVLPMPPLPPGVLAQDFYLQAAVLNAAGVGLLGGGSAVTVLDAGI